MFWSGSKIESRLPELLSPYHVKHIDCSAYTLHVGREVYISADGNSTEPQLGRNLQREERFEIPPGQFAFLLTDEILTVPNDVMALINVKSSIKLRGLINVSGFHVDPGYSGRLVISVFNAGPAPIVLSAGDPCFLIWFADLDGDPSYYYRKPGFNRINSDLISRVPSRNTSLLTVSRDLSLLKNKTDLVFNIVIGVGVPFFIAVLVALTQIFAQKWYENSTAVPAELFSGYFLTYVASALTVIFVIFLLKRRLDR